MIEELQKHLEELSVTDEVHISSLLKLKEWNSFITEAFAEPRRSQLKTLKTL